MGELRELELVDEIAEAGAPFRVGTSSFVESSMAGVATSGSC
jgi:hypothetical protein